MKSKGIVRVLSAAAGLVLLAAAGCFAAEAFFGVGVMAALGAFWQGAGAVQMLLKLLALLMIAALAVGCLVLALYPWNKAARSGFVMQQGENGAIGISIKTIEGMVRSCVQKHESILQADVAITEQRQGLMILLEADQAPGMNIPLSVGALQKQVRQYVSECTGMDVCEVRVMVENSDVAVLTSTMPPVESVAAPAPAVQDVPVETADVEVPEAEVTAVEEQVGETEMEVELPEAAPAVEEVVTVAAETLLPDMPQDEETDDRPLHQRLFGAEEQPVTVPVPPEMAQEQANQE